MFDLYSYPMPLISLAGLAVILAVSEIGWRLGVRADHQAAGNITTLESGMLGLLALMIAFTFSMALSRFDARREAVLNEANSIGTTALRARLLPEPHRTETLKLLRNYVQLRVDIVRSGASLAEAAAAIDQSNMIQEALWQQTIAIGAKDKAMIPTGLFVTSLNGMIDDQGKRLAALRARMPNFVLLTLFSIAAVAGGFAGFASGLDAKRTRLPIYVMAVLISAVIYLILDLDRPSSGFITNNQQPIIDAASTIDAFPELK